MQTPQPTWQEISRAAKLRLLRLHYEAGVGHIGGNLSCMDILLCLFHKALGPNDQFVLSKGHAAGALYLALWSSGLINEADLLTFYKDDTLLSAHPPPAGLPRIEFATGSLGHGVSLASGLSLAKKLSNKPGRVFCVTSDGEWNEGSSWEAIIFARHQKLSALTLIVDLNGLQGFGSTKEVADLDSLADKFRAFGWPTVEIDGHDSAELDRAILDPQGLLGPGPRVVVCKTSKGAGVSYMEHKMEWHYLPMKEADYAQAIREVSER